jgi:hypothetical protein
MLIYAASFDRHHAFRGLAIGRTSSCRWIDLRHHCWIGQAAQPPRHCQGTTFTLRDGSVRGPEAATLLGANYLATGAVRRDGPRAFDAADRGLLADPRDPAAHWAMGRALWLRKDDAASLSSLEEAVVLSPSFAMAHYTRGFVEAQTGDAAAAVLASDFARQLSPFDPMLYAMCCVRAFALVRLGRYEEAAEWATRMLQRVVPISTVRVRMDAPRKLHEFWIRNLTVMPLHEPRQQRSDRTLREVLGGGLDLCRRHKQADRAHVVKVRVAHHANMHLVIGAFLARECCRNDGGANPRSEAQRTIGKRLEPLNRRAIDPATTLSRIPVVRRSRLDHQRHRDDADHCRFARIPGSHTVVVDTASTHARPKMPTPVELAIAAALTGQKPEPDPIKC